MNLMEPVKSPQTKVLHRVKKEREQKCTTFSSLVDRCPASRRMCVKFCVIIKIICCERSILGKKDCFCTQKHTKFSLPSKTDQSQP